MLFGVVTAKWKCCQPDALAPGAILQQELNSVTVEAEATHLPTEVELSIEGLKIGTQVTMGDLKLPTGSTLVNDPEQLVVAITEAPSEAQIDAELAEAAEELGIVEDAPDSDEAGESNEGNSEGSSDSQ